MRWTGLALVVLMLASVPAAAQDRLDAATKALDRVIAEPKAETATVERMAAVLHVAPAVLRAQRAGTPLGWGDFFMAHRIAVRGGHPVEKVFAARRTGAAWDAIAEEANVSPDALVQDVATVWPDAARAPQPTGTVSAPATATSKEAPKGFGARMRDLFGGAPTPPAAESGRDETPADRTQEDIRNQMIRGGGRSR